MSTEIFEGSLYSSVAEFYEGKSIFITGGTGFVGKVIVERLLWNCPKINKIYILVREKNGVSAKRRIEELLDHVLFTKLKETRPDDLSKIVPIAGDIGLNYLGINKADEEMLIEKVNIVIHTAATIKFNEPLKVALNMNLEGTNQLLNLCHRMKKLEVFVHTSTAYSNSDKKFLQEIVYPVPLSLTDIYLQVERDHLNADLKNLLNKHPNTYTFTKSLAEHLVAEKHGNLKTIIIRPSIVTGVANDPLPGWIDNWYGATRILTHVGKGISRMLWGSNSNILDLIPVDFVANLFIIAIAKHLRSRELVVYNCCSSFSNPITLKDVTTMFAVESIKHQNNTFPLPRWHFITMNTKFASVVTFFLQILPALFADLWNRILGRSTSFVKMQKYAIALRDSLKFFTSNTWVMSTSGAAALYSSLSTDDQKRFPCDVTQLNWNEYIPTYCAGIRRYLENK